jgi:hypothetical protein
MARMIAQVQPQPRPVFVYPVLSAIPYRPTRMWCPAQGCAPVKQDIGLR